jgi:predicted nucleic-acid-binding Zn-ribbon protein
MKYCNECNILPVKYKDQIDFEKNKFHVIKCERCGLSTTSYVSFNNAVKQWNALNKKIEALTTGTHEFIRYLSKDFDIEKLDDKFIDEEWKQWNRNNN